MAQKWYNKASVQTALVSGIFLILVSMIGMFPLLEKTSIEPKEKWETIQAFSGYIGEMQEAGVDYLTHYAKRRDSLESNGFAASNANKVLTLQAHKNIKTDCHELTTSMEIFFPVRENQPWFDRLQHIYKGYKLFLTEVSLAYDEDLLDKRYDEIKTMLDQVLDELKEIEGGLIEQTNT